MSVLEMIPIKKIVAGENPRGSIDVKGEKFKELCSSIEAQGILQPILVGPSNGDATHKVIAGHRRFAAAAKLKLPELPALIVDFEGSELIASLIENVQREDLSPVAEARAIKELQERHNFTQVQAGVALSKSERWVRERLRLLPLPPKTQKAYDEGDLPLESLVTVEKLAKQAPQAAEALAVAAGKSDDVRNAVGGNRVSDALEYIEEDKGADPLGCMLRVRAHGGVVEFEDLVKGGATKKQLDAAKNALAESKNLASTYKRVGGWINDRDLDYQQLGPDGLAEAKAYGCLLELNDGMYITDVEWLADRFVDLQKRQQQSLTDKISARKREKSDGKGDEKGADDEKAKEAKKKQRADEQQQREDARTTNLELGQLAQRAFAKFKLSLDEEKLIALMIVGKSPGDVATRGLVYCHHDLQEVETLKNGRARVTYTDKHEAGQALLKEIKNAKRAGEPLALALRTVILAHYADQTCVAPSSRSYFDITQVADREVVGLIESIADQRNLLPETIKVGKAKAKAIHAEKREMTLLLMVKASRSKLGVSRDLLVAATTITPDLVDAAVKRKHLKEHTNADDLKYSITAAGTKRLEKLKAAEKEREAAA